MNISPGIAAMCWLLASLITAAVIARAARSLKRTPRRIASPCYCGNCDR